MSNRIAELDPIRPRLEKFVEGTAAKLGESAICLSIFTEDYKQGIDSLLQFSIALMMDKPIYLLAPEGTKIPERVRRIADGIEFFRGGDEESMHKAATKLLNDAAGKHFTE